MITEMLEAATSAASVQIYVEDKSDETRSQPAAGSTIPERLLEELADIIADALVASIERDHALITADC
jgi:hypothetical protein